MNYCYTLQQFLPSKSYGPSFTNCSVPVSVLHHAVDNNILPVAWFFSKSFVFMAWQSVVGHGLLIFEASWSHWVRHVTLSRISVDEWSAQCNLYLTTHNTHKRRPCTSLAGLKTTFQARKWLIFYNIEYQFIPDRELVNRMIPDVLTDDEDSEPVDHSAYICYYFDHCLCFLIVWRSAQTTWGTHSALAPERRKNFQNMFRALSCTQGPIKLFTQLHTQ